MHVNGRVEPRRGEQNSVQVEKTDQTEPNNKFGLVSTNFGSSLETIWGGLNFGSEPKNWEKNP